MGEIIEQPLMRNRMYSSYPAELDTETFYYLELKATWDEYVPEEIHEWRDFGENLSETIEAHIGKHTETLEIQIRAYGDSVYVKAESDVGGYKEFRFEGPDDKKKLEEIIASDCLARDDQLPYTKRKEEAAGEIRNFRLRHPFTHLPKRG